MLCEGHEWLDGWMVRSRMMMRFIVNCEKCGQAKA